MMDRLEWRRIERYAEASAPGAFGVCGRHLIKVSASKQMLRAEVLDAETLQRKVFHLPAKSGVDATTQVAGGWEYLYVVNVIGSQVLVDVYGLADEAFLGRTEITGGAARMQCMADGVPVLACLAPGGLTEIWEITGRSVRRITVLRACAIMSATAGEDCIVLTRATDRVPLWVDLRTGRARELGPWRGVVHWTDGVRFVVTRAWDGSGIETYDSHSRRVAVVGTDAGEGRLLGVGAQGALFAMLRAEGVVSRVVVTDAAGRVYGRSPDGVAGPPVAFSHGRLFYKFSDLKTPSHWRCIRVSEAGVRPQQRARRSVAQRLRCATVTVSSCERTEFLRFEPHSAIKGSVLMLHGGPGGRWAYEYNGLAMMLAEMGLRVLAPNPAGSAGYGRLHETAIIGQWGLRDVQDVLQLWEAHRGGELQVVVGESYGGFLALRAIAIRPEWWDLGVVVAGFWSPRALYQAAGPRLRQFLKAWKVADLDFGPPVPACSRPRVVLVHGDRDLIVPVEQCYYAGKKLREGGFVLGRDVVVPVLSGEGHLFSLEGRLNMMRIIADETARAYERKRAKLTAKGIGEGG